MARRIVYGAVSAAGMALAAWSCPAAETIDDVRVDALVASHWDQLYAGGNILFGQKCYNYYTPGEKHCGCTATALAQVMRYHEWPKTAVEAKTYACKVYVKGDPNADDMGLIATNLTMIGGVYDWTKMPHTTLRTGNDDEQMEMIGRLCYDVGVAMSSSYQNGMTAAGAYSAIHTFPKNFHYASAEAINWTLSSNMAEYSLERFQQMIVPSLDAGLPCVLTIYGQHGGHTVVCDGYGFDGGEFMIHVNGGYSGVGDGWHSPTNIQNICGYDYTSMNGVVFNISPTNTGAIASGRILDGEGCGIANAEVTVTLNGTTVKRMKSNAKGIYFFWGMPGTYDIVAAKDGVSASTQATLGKNVSIDVYQDGSYSYPLSAVAIGNSCWNDIVLDKDAVYAATPVASWADRTKFKGKLLVGLSSQTDGATIRYTTDGTTPNEHSAAYAGPLTFTQTTTLKAVAYKTGFLPSKIASWTFIETTLGEAIECDDLPWRTGGDFGGWYVVTDHSADGVDAVRSAIASTYQYQGTSTWLETEVVGPGTLSFTYSMTGYYYSPFTVTLDGTTTLLFTKPSWGSNTIWYDKTFEIPSGTHTLRFAFTAGQLGYPANYQNGVWLDKVTYVPLAPTSQPLTFWIE